MAKLVGNKTFPISGQADGLVYRQTREGVVVARRPNEATAKLVHGG